MEEALRSSLRSRPEMSVATWLGWVGPGLVGHEVATRKWRRDLARLQWVSGLASWDWMSRHHFEVVTWVAAREVTTWRRDVAEMGLS